MVNIFTFIKPFSFIYSSIRTVFQFNFYLHIHNLSIKVYWIYKQHLQSIECFSFLIPKTTPLSFIFYGVSISLFFKSFQAYVSHKMFRFIYDPFFHWSNILLLLRYLLMGAKIWFFSVLHMVFVIWTFHRLQFYCIDLKLKMVKCMGMMHKKWNDFKF